MSPTILQAPFSLERNRPIQINKLVTMIYLDYNASTPIDPAVAKVMQPLLEQHYGNPSSLHWAGAPAREIILHARQQVADLLACEADEIVFTSGGSEANNLALKGVFFAQTPADKPIHIITTQIEHPAILEPCHFLQRLGAEVTYLAVDSSGIVDPDDVRQAIRPQTRLISVMHANNEVGTIQPIADISEIAKQHDVLIHTDAAQSIGKIPCQVDALGVDLLSIAGHKLYAPKGVGALYIRRGTKLESLLHGAGHEAGRRASTESALLIAGLGKACELAAQQSGVTTVRQLRDKFWQDLRTIFADRVVLNGHPEQRLPNTLNVSFVGRDGSELLAKLAAEGVAASTGSACHEGMVEMSPVLSAMNTPAETGMGAIRFSLGRASTAADIEQVVALLQKIL